MVGALNRKSGGIPHPASAAGPRGASISGRRPKRQKHGGALIVAPETRCNAPGFRQTIMDQPKNGGTGSLARRGLLYDFLCPVPAETPLSILAVMLIAIISGFAKTVKVAFPQLSFVNDW
jgi:hypothetical protein